MEAAIISVIVPCFNHGEFLRAAVASVTALQRSDVELIVVDDGSTNEQTRAEMNVLAAEGIRVIRQENRGLAAARNAGIAASQGKYILPLDADNRLRPAYIARGIQILDRDDAIGIVYGDAEYVGTRTGQWHVGPFARNKLLRWNYIDACAVFRRSVWEQNNGYDSTMPVQGVEDWDFWLGALERGWQFAYVPEVLFEYRVANESMITRTRGFEREIEAFVARKHGLLYRRAWQELDREHKSVRATQSNLFRLLRDRLTHRAESNQVKEDVVSTRNLAQT